MLSLLRILALLAIFFFFIFLQYNRGKPDLEPSPPPQPCCIQIEKKSDLRSDTTSAEVTSPESAGPKSAEVSEQGGFDESSLPDPEN